MKITVLNQEVDVEDEEVLLAKKVVDDFYEKIKEHSNTIGKPSFYYTALLVSYIKINDVFDMCDPKMIGKVYN